MKLNKKIFNLVKKDTYRIKDIDDFKRTISIDYTLKNEKLLKYTIYNLLPLKDKNSNKYSFDFGSFNKYLKPLDNKLVVSDNDNTYLKNIDDKKVLKDFSKMNYLQYMNEDKNSLFITFTNPSKYHFYKHKTKKGKKRLVSNSECKSLTLGETIEKSFINMNKIKREYYKLVKKYLKRKKLDIGFDFVSVLENHKNMSIHNHSVFYVSNEQLKVFKQCYRTIKKRFKLKQCKFIVLNKSKSSSYLMKYMLKYDSDFYKHYRRYFSKYRFFTSSKVGIVPQKIIDITYNHLKKYQKSIYYEYKNSDKPMVVSLVEHILDNYIIEYEDKTVEVIKYQKLQQKINEDFNSLYECHLLDLDQIEQMIYQKYKDNEEVLDYIDYKNDTVKELKKITDKKGNVIYEKKDLVIDTNRLKRLNIC